MIGFDGTKAGDSLQDVLQRTGARSVILFARNVTDADQTLRLTEEIRSLVDHPLVIAIDQEGGRVVRLTRGVTHFPGNAALGRTDDPELCRAVGHATAQEMAACGIDLVLAPVVDLAVESRNPIVGYRSFGERRERVAPLASAFLDGLEAGGCSGCLKHFPGLGLSVVDPHVGLPEIHASLEELHDPHIEVFRDVFRTSTTSPAVMTTHVVLPEIDAAHMATASETIVCDLLRKRLGFNGCVMTDDMEMGGAAPLGSMAAAVLAAAHAGHDLMPICHRADLQLEAAAALHDALGSGLLDVEEHQESVRRIDALGRRQGRAAQPDPGRARALAERVAREACGMLQDPEGVVREFGQTDWEVIGTPETPVATFRRLLGARPGGKRGRVVLVGTSSGRDQESLSAEIDDLMTVYVLLDSPARIHDLPARATVATACGRSPSQLAALAEMLQGNA